MTLQFLFFAAGPGLGKLRYVIPAIGLSVPKYAALEAVAKPKPREDNAFIYASFRSINTTRIIHRSLDTRKPLLIKREVHHSELLCRAYYFRNSTMEYERY